MSTSAELRNGRIANYQEINSASSEDLEAYMKLSATRMIIGEEIDATKTGIRPNYQMFNSGSNAN